MYKIQIIAVSAKEFTVKLFDDRGTHIVAYSITKITAYQAYIFIRGIYTVFTANIDSPLSLSVWRYIISITSTERDRN